MTTAEIQQLHQLHALLRLLESPSISQKARAKIVATYWRLRLPKTRGK